MTPNIHDSIGELIDVGGHCLNINAAGEGSPSVVLEEGTLSYCLDWHLVQTQAAKFCQVYSYDRAGFGWSDPGPQPRHSAQIVMEFHALLTQVEIRKPFILVGASFGGHTTRLYAKTYPKVVTGIILVDVRHEDISAKMLPAWKKLENAGLITLRMLFLASRTGTLKLLGKLMGKNGAPPNFTKLPIELHEMYLKVGYQPQYFLSNLGEFAVISESDAQLRTVGKLGNLPLIVIRHGLTKMFAEMPAEQSRQAKRVWQELQTDLANLSSNSHLLVAEKSGHNIPVDQPDVVIDAIQMVVDAARQNSDGKEVQS